MFLSVENTVNNFFSLMLSTFKFLYGIKQFHYPQLVESSLTCNFSETGLFLRVVITIPFSFLNEQDIFSPLRVNSYIGKSNV